MNNMVSKVKGPVKLSWLVINDFASNLNNGFQTDAVLLELKYSPRYPMMHYLVNYTTVKSGAAPLDGFNTFWNIGLNNHHQLLYIYWVPQGTVQAHYCFYVI